MHRNFVSGILLFGAMLASGCKDGSTVDSSDNVVAQPTMTLAYDKASPRELTVEITNPSDTKIEIPGFEEELIYGVYWYRGDAPISVPQCGTGFWETTIEVPPKGARELKASIPTDALTGGLYTLAVVYGGHGPSADEPPTTPESPDAHYIRHPDIAMHCRKIEAQVTLPTK